MKISLNYGNKTRKIIVVLLAILYMCMTIALPLIERNGGIMLFGSLPISGLITCIQFGLALLIALLDYELGGTLSTVLIVVSLLATAMSFLNGRAQANAFLGLVYGIISLLIVLFTRSRIERERKSALTDDLTGISNRKHIIQYIEHLILKKTPFYIIYIDIDDFKLINETYGHEKGDEVIKILAKEWSKIDSRRTVLGRYGGDQFLAVMRQKDCLDVKSMAGFYADAVNRLIDDGDEFFPNVSVSIGIVEYPKHDSKAVELLRKADIAVNRATKLGRNQILEYDNEFEEQIVREQYIETRIKKALDEKLFYMVYQPQFVIGTKKLRGFESLIRMRAIDEDPLYPGDFIPVAEKSDLIIDIGEYVLKRVTSDFAPILSSDKDFVVSINISAKQMLSKDFVNVVRRALDDTGFNPRNLEIEITEYCLMDTTDSALKIINELKDMGIMIAMDDFGTGYSSLSYLTKLPIDLLKIDKSIVDEMGAGEIVGAICSMGHALSCEIIAEGVEEEEQLDILREKGCDLIQGYIWGKPMAYEDALELI